MDEKFIKIHEAANILGVSSLTLRNWDKLGKLKACRHPINNYRVYPQQEIQNIINKIKSGESIPIKNSKIIKSNKIGKSNSYILKVIHLKD